MNILEITLYILIGIVLIGAALLFIWISSRGWYNKKQMKRVAPIFRGRSTVHHPTFGSGELVSADPLTTDSAQCRIVDLEGHSHEWKAFADEFKPRNVWQAMIGGHPEWDYIPSTERMHQYVRDRTETEKLIAATVEAKKGREEALDRARVAEVRIDQKVQKGIETAAAVQRSTQPQGRASK